jgi:hypothetical protein
MRKEPRRWLAQDNEQFPLTTANIKDLIEVVESAPPDIRNRGHTEVTDCCRNVSRIHIRLWR